MRRWWQGSPGDEQPPGVPVPPPEGVEEPMELPDPIEAERALRDQITARKRMEDLSVDVWECLDFLKSAREENHFAEGIIALIKAGR